MGPTVLALFLLGLALGKLGIAAQLSQRRRLLWRTLIFAALIGVPGNLAYALAAELLLSRLDGMMLLFAVATLAAPALCLAYACAFLLAWPTGVGQRILGPLRPVGRMALTNYLFQSLVCTTIFYGYGGGWFGSVGPAAGLLIALAVFAVQIPLSHAWLARFEFGPAEWLWRSLTYGRRQPWRRAAA
jgi:uncharacterized protein